MRILYLNYLYDIKGCSLGSAIKPLELFRAMEELGHDVKICWMKKQPDSNGFLPLAQKPFLKRILSRYLSDAKQLLMNIPYFIRVHKIAKVYKPDIIVSRIERCLFSDLLLAKLKNIPYVFEADCPAIYEALQFQQEYKRYKHIGRLIEKSHTRLADAVVVVSNNLKKYFNVYDGRPGRIEVVTNGADPDRFSLAISGNEIVAHYGLEKKVVIGFIGSFSAWHGVKNLTSLIQEITAEFSDVTFLLVGSGGDKMPEMRAFVEKNNLQKNVVLTGHVEYDNMPNYIAAMDVVLAPYPDLPFFYYSPVKMYEYMALGKPIVTTRIGQIAEVLSDGNNAALCEPGDTDGMIERVRALVRNSKLRKSLGLAARDTVVQNYTWIDKARDWERICFNTMKKSLKSE